MTKDAKNSTKSSLNEYAVRQSALLKVDQVGDREADFTPTITLGSTEKGRITLNNFRDLMGGACTERAHQFARIADGLVYLVYMPSDIVVGDDLVALAWSQGFLSWQMVRLWDYLRNDPQQSAATGNLHIHHMCYEIPRFLDIHRQPLKPFLEDHGESSG